MQQKSIITRLAIQYTGGGTVLAEINRINQSYPETAEAYRAKSEAILGSLREARKVLVFRQGLGERFSVESQAETEQAIKKLDQLIHLFDDSSRYSNAPKVGELAFSVTFLRLKQENPDYSDIAIAQLALEKVTQAADVPFRGANTTRLYKLVDFLKQAYDIPNVGPEPKHGVIVVLYFIASLTIFFGAATALTVTGFLWPVFVAGVAFGLLLWLTKLAVNHFPFNDWLEAVSYNQDKYQDYGQKIFNCFNVTLELDEIFPNGIEAVPLQNNEAILAEPQPLPQQVDSTPSKNDTPSKVPIPCVFNQEKPKAGITIVARNDLRDYQANYMAVRALTIIESRCEQAVNRYPDNKELKITLKIIQNNLQIFNQEGNEDNSYLGVNLTVEVPRNVIFTHDLSDQKINAKATIHQVKNTINGLMNNQQICKVDSKEWDDVFRLTIPHENVRVIVDNDQDFEVEKFSPPQPILGFIF